MIRFVARVLHQFRLLGRSVRHLRRNPRDGRELGRLLATMGRGTMSLRLPWLPFRLIAELESVATPGASVFEFGGGGSTLWFLDRGTRVVTVEDHEGWSKRLRDSIGEADSWTLIRRDITDGYVEAVEDYADETFDVVLVDGKERPACLVAAAAKVRRGGLLVLDDADRSEYGPALRSLGWPQRLVVGFAPAKPSLGYSLVLTRP